MDHEDGRIDWDAAFEALVAPLRPPRYVRVARVAGQAAAASVVIAVACWLTLRLIAEPLADLGRPWL